MILFGLIMIFVFAWIGGFFMGLSIKNKEKEEVNK